MRTAGNLEYNKAALDKLTYWHCSTFPLSWACPALFSLVSVGLVLTTFMKIMLQLRTGMGLRTLLAGIKWIKLSERVSQFSLKKTIIAKEYSKTQLKSVATTQCLPFPITAIRIFLKKKSLRLSKPVSKITINFSYILSCFSPHWLLLV